MTRRIIYALMTIYVGIIGLLVQIRLDKPRAEVRMANNMIFPLQTTKAAIKDGSQYDGQTLVWYSDALRSYHHDYLAADIHVNEGTPVVVAKGGEVVMVRQAEKCDYRHFPGITIRGVDGFYYYYTHLKPGSFNVRVGDQVASGDQFAQVGSAACAQGSAPHLHFDVSRFPFAIRGGLWSQVTMIDPQPALIKAYQSLPEK